MNPVLIQFIGLLALLTNLSLFQTNTRKNMLLLGLATCLFWAVHFYFLNAMTGFTMNLIAAGRFLAYYKIRSVKQNRWLLWLFIGIALFATVLTWKGAISLLPFVGTTCMVIAFWETNTKHIRRLALISSPPWIIYGLMVGSYPVIAAETLLIASNLIGQYRFDYTSAFRHANALRK